VNKPRVVIVDDHPMFAQTVAKLFEPDCDVVGVYDDPNTFLLDAVALKPDLVTVDVSMPLMEGLEAVKRLRELIPTSKVIILTMNEDAEVATEALRRGVSGYVLKRSAVSELRAAVREVLAGRRFFTPLVIPHVTPAKTRAKTRAHQPRKHAGQITPRQREVLRLLAGGRSIKEASAILNLSTRTVKFHKYRLMEQLQVRSTAELIKFAVLEGLV
jgi:DNA-binding NarL/FixJ family response regulator